MQRSCDLRLRSRLAAPCASDDRDWRLTGMEVDVVATYRCFLVRGERIRSVQIFECADDAEVSLKAAAFLTANPGHQGMEIWQAGRFVVRVPSRSEA